MGANGDQDGFITLFEESKRDLQTRVIEFDLGSQACGRYRFSLFRILLGRRYSGIPTASIPPATGRASKNSDLIAINGGGPRQRIKPGKALHE